MTPVTVLHSVRTFVLNVGERRDAGLQKSHIVTAADLVSVSLALGARTVPGWSQTEEDLLGRQSSFSLPLFVVDAQASIDQGRDPLGEAFCNVFSNEQRRPRGATYTPQPIVEAMLGWAACEVRPARIVDPGVGSARFLVTAGRHFPDAQLVGVEVDPLAAIIARGHLAAAGFAHRSEVILQDYREICLPEISRPTLFLGNPPYVRHHLIEPMWKTWLSATARSLGHQASQLAGLHVHFFLATAKHARPGDFGVLITSSEWLDVNYGRLVRELLMGVLGAKTIHVIEPTADPFPGTQTTAVITGFAIGERPEAVGLRRAESVAELGKLSTNWSVRRERLETADRWSPLTRPNTQRREGFIELGELCRVHRGQVTGANRIWIDAANRFRLPEHVLLPTVTRARELFAADGCLADSSVLRRVIDLPVDLDSFQSDERRQIDRFLRFARSQDVQTGFVAQNRKAWWSVGLRGPAPILATYMARRPPVFVRNMAEARHINIAHGLYPRATLTNDQLSILAAYLSRSVSTAEGRTYAGGLTKFEPREMERLLVPRPELLNDSVLSGARL